ncbi:hypothetical protein SAMN05216359_11244 [Roseateles sp. YR242]|uniref:hypothetical protein n=1 Tax=Roseateles sp. YR242 TaxID=1855305 RepID=UPI0008B6AD88|nr:hypothetical protein [Roseateles sp. YR242]SEL61170.1 hypothetical protein SAMN05216359_11244 [Roseateles sp. YR242]
MASLAHAEDSVLVPPDDTVAGASQALWSQRWWEWAGSFPMEMSPIADKTGDLCTNGQSGDVWFLAGTYGTKRAVRTCHVPQGKYLFFPLINYVAYPPYGHEVSCMQVMTDAARLTNAPGGLVLAVDGVRFTEMAQHRQLSPACFDLGAKALPARRMYPAAANGYYAMLKPLSPGRHTVEFGGSLPSMYQAVTYQLIVE